jgi:hypothetical protein
VIPEKISFRPGNLAGAMGKKLDETGETPSVYVRRLIAEDCDRKPPKMDGHIKVLNEVNKRKKKAVE